MTGSNGSRPGHELSEAQVEAMISLLTDHSPEVVESCRRALVDCSHVSEPLLRRRLRAAQQGGEGRAASTAAGAAAAGSGGVAVDAAIVASVLDDIAMTRVADSVVAELLGAADLERGSVLVGRLVDHGPEPDRVGALLDALADQVRAALREENADPVAALTAVLARQRGLRGLHPARAKPSAALVHGVLTRGCGLPLPLSIVWLLVARRCELPLVGINMPGHFIVRFDRDTGPVLLDPFSGGAVLRAERCQLYLERNGFPRTDLDLLEATDRDMLLRTLRNLVMIGRRRERASLAACCERILGLVERGRLR